MILKYYSQWVFYLFILWLLGYLLKVDVITKYINPYYTTLVSAVGFTFWIFYTIGFKGHHFELSFLLFLIATHFVPLYISYKYSNKTYITENLIGSLIVYGIYMTINNKDPFNVYLVDEYVNSWNELYKMCKSKNKVSILCNLL
jgi:hypothetical protein